MIFHPTELTDEEAQLILKLLKDAGFTEDSYTVGGVLREKMLALLGAAPS